MDEIKVKKRDGSLEGWSFDKLVASISKTSISIPEAEKIARSVEAWARENAEDDVMESTRVRDKITETLKEDYPAEADSYQTYKKV